MLVVVPTESGSYLPGPTFRTFGAVCNKAAPRQSTGGATCSSKTRIMLASRMPKITPSRSTESPTRSWRTSDSVKGVLNRYSTMNRDAFCVLRVRTQTQPVHRPALSHDGVPHASIAYSQQRGCRRYSSTPIRRARQVRLYFHQGPVGRLRFGLSLRTTRPQT